MHYVYVIFRYYEWLEFKRNGTIPEDEPVYKHEWVYNQVRRRTGLDNALALYCFADKPHHHYPPKRIVCKVRIPNEHIVYFDDTMYIHVLNDMNNNKHSFNGWSEMESEQNKNASVETCLASYERMFDINGAHLREYRWIGPVEKRAFIPYLTRSMIRKVWVYRNAKRLRAK